MSSVDVSIRRRTSAFSRTIRAWYSTLADGGDGVEEEREVVLAARSPRARRAGQLVGQREESTTAPRSFIATMRAEDAAVRLAVEHGVVHELRGAQDRVAVHDHGARTACSASSDQGGRRSRNASGTAGAIEESSSKLDIFPGRAFPRRIPEQRRRDGRSPPAARRSSGGSFREALPMASFVFSSVCAANVPNATITFGRHQLDLPNEIRTACLHLVRDGIPVSRRPMLQHVADKHVVARELDRREDLVEQLAGRAHERASGLVLVCARGLRPRTSGPPWDFPRPGRGASRTRWSGHSRARRHRPYQVVERSRARRRSAEQLAPAATNR